MLRCLWMNTRVQVFHLVCYFSGVQLESSINWEDMGMNTFKVFRLVSVHIHILILTHTHPYAHSQTYSHIQKHTHILNSVDPTTLPSKSRSLSWKFPSPQDLPNATSNHVTLQKLKSPAFPVLTFRTTFTAESCTGR